MIIQKLFWDGVETQKGIIERSSGIMNFDMGAMGKKYQKQAPYVDHRHFRDSTFLATQPCVSRPRFAQREDRDGGPLIRDLCSAQPGEQNLHGDDDGRSKMSQSKLARRHDGDR